MLLGAAGQFSINSAIKIESEEAFAIMCLKQAEKGWISFTVESKDEVLWCNLIDQIEPSDVEMEQIFWEVSFPVLCN